MAEAVHPVSSQRSALWRSACAKKITTAHLYRRLAELRSKYSDEALYDSEVRARKRRMAA
ncbi:hypothetical protein ACVWXQ_001837 [Bradyrhizobium sp. S3.14.4]